MSNNINPNSHTIIMGAGIIAIEYARILRKMEKSFSVIGRGEKSAREFQAATNVEPYLGLRAFQTHHKNAPPNAIVSVNIDQLAPASEMLLEWGVKRLLVEKPAGLNHNDIRGLAALAERHGASLYVAYNRRHYVSVRAARQLIAEDGGVQSFHFEFTEWTHEIDKLPLSETVKKNWFLANSSHVVDLAFYLGGLPIEIHSFISGQNEISWHNKSAVFAGAGRTKQGGLFSYQANWISAGRWSIEVMTRKRRFIFRPLEKLQVQMLGSVAVSDVVLDDSIDKEFKPGFYNQVEEFYKESSQLLSIREHIEQLNWFEKMVAE
ncbi:Gfo/Idh/MocA family oxidoreductase [Oligoflexus tunisiensis]|uniref:Gfo/Idh/MocA family oxidoreductase n=1 Tax=Oligoflexus tunisiensis TaxID=708132 RepID=UPI000B2DF2FE|nr:Gfo/Idh/MocA family oxidoreductase [Oligoflexus tunisiensis]